MADNPEISDCAMELLLFYYDGRPIPSTWTPEQMGAARKELLDLDMIKLVGVHN